MNGIQIYCEKFKKTIDEIKQFIEGIDLQKSMIRELIRYDTDLKGKISNTLQYGKIIKEIAVTPIQYNAVIISVYGCFEQFIDNVFDWYCNNLCNVASDYAELPQEIKDKHIKKLGDFLVNTQRYKSYNLDEINAIQNAYVAFDNPKDGLVKNRCLLLNHGGNLKIDQIKDLAKGLGVENFVQKITENIRFKSYFIEQGIHSEQTYQRLKGHDAKALFDVLNQLVEARNNVAHAWVEERIELNLVKEKWLEYLKILSEAICITIQTSFVEYLYNTGKLYGLGKPLDVIDGRIICINSGGVILKVEDNLIAKDGEGKIKLFKIKEIKVDGKSINETEDIERNIGIELVSQENLNIHKNFEFYYYKWY